ncbi:leukocyte surface antigen CD47 [Phaethornis superciliosus]
MWLTAVWVQLVAVGAGSAQLLFNATDLVEINQCNTTVILPCYVTNLKKNTTKAMFVKWMFPGKLVYSFDGERERYFRDPSTQSTDLVSEVNLPKGIASLKISNAEAKAGNYTCQVTESNREGQTKIELRTSSGPWFLLMESTVIISLPFVVTVLCLAQIIVVVLKYEIETLVKTGIFVAGIILTAAPVAGAVLFVQDGYTPKNQAGLGLIVVPDVILVPLQYLMFRIVFNSLPQAAYALIVLHILGYIIALVGFGLCVSVCPPLHGSVVIAGLAILAIASLLSLADIFIMGCRMKDHPHPGKAVEEPLNDAKGVMLE